MSISSDKGVSLENHIAKTLQKKLGARVSRDKRSGAGSHQKMDISNYFGDIPFDIEAKNHKTISIKDWMRQARAGASIGRIPTVIFRTEDDVLACLPLDDLVDLAVQIKDLTATIADLRRPIEVAEAVEKAVSFKQTTGVTTCRNGHICSPGSNKCLDKKCQFSSTYKKPKVKK